MGNITLVREDTFNYLVENIIGSSAPPSIRLATKACENGLNGMSVRIVNNG
jgi:hypothetical protein